MNIFRYSLPKWVALCTTVFVMSGSSLSISPSLHAAKPSKVREEDQKKNKKRAHSYKVVKDFREAVKLRKPEDVEKARQSLYQSIYQYNGNNGQAPHNSCENEVRFICQKDIGKNGYTINSSGEYRLAEDIVFNPKASDIGRSAITINVPNVVLDLNNKTLSQGSTRTSITIGIQVNAVDAVVVQNGNITDFTRWGIFFNPGGSDITVQNLDVLRCGVIEGTRDTVGDLPTGGISAIHTDNMVFSRVNANRNFGVGLYLQEVQNIVVAKSSFNQTVGGTFFGVQPPVNSVGNIGYGLVVYTSTPNVRPCKNIVCIDCNANDTKAGAIVTGIGFFSAANPAVPMENITAINCNANNGYNTGFFDYESDSTGFALVNVNNFLLLNCSGNSNEHPFPPSPVAFPGLNSATGYSINLSTGGVIEGCVANNNSGQGLTTEGMRFRNCKQIEVRNCVASNNYNYLPDSEDVYGESWGIRNVILLGLGGDLVGVDYVIDSCVAQNNTALSGISGGMVAANLINCRVQNCIFQGNKNFDPLNSSIFRQSWGILTTDSIAGIASANNIFEGNNVEGNAVAGIEDQTPAALNAYLKNIARSNGGNYVNLPSGTPIANWTVGSPAPSISPIDNLSITP